MAGAIAPFMTLVIGQAVDTFAKFPLTPNPPQSAKDVLLHAMAVAAFELIDLAIGSVTLSSLMSSLWIWTGEHNVMALRKRVYATVTQKDMVWFDTKMGTEGTIQSAEEEPTATAATHVDRTVTTISTVKCCTGMHGHRKQEASIAVSALPGGGGGRHGWEGPGGGHGRMDVQGIFIGSIKHVH
ncbi:hypothetical protein FB451DRAFT_1164693 [Mycena latifolia]|nr:hypothetical protein FB451DRAFT_1164693 [Mycena latifolia]